MRFLTFAASACAIALTACSGGSGSTSTMSTQPLVSVVGCLSQQGGDFVLTRPANRAQGSGGVQGTAGTAMRYRLVDEGRTGVDRYVDRQIQVTGKIENPGAESRATMPTIRVTQLSSLGGCQ